MAARPRRDVDVGRSWSARRSSAARSSCFWRTTVGAIGARPIRQSTSRSSVPRSGGPGRHRSARASLRRVGFGPYTSMGDGVCAEDAEVENSIVLEVARITHLDRRLESSVIGPGHDLAWLPTAAGATGFAWEKGPRSRAHIGPLALRLSAGVGRHASGVLRWPETRVVPIYANSGIRKVRKLREYLGIPKRNGDCPRAQPG